jgi:hypothetical protein
MRNVILALGLVTVLVIPALGTAEDRHSGTVVAVDPGAGVMVIEELTASRDERPRSLRRTLAVDTNARVVRQEPTLEGYRAVPMSLLELRPGDFVTVVAMPRGTGAVATTIELVRPDASPSASPR